MSTHIETYSTPTILAKAAARRFSDLAYEATCRRGRFCVALSGGSTPEALYRCLTASSGEHVIDWGGIHVFWGDERCVPPDHDCSNYRMALDALLRKVSLPPQQIHRIRGEDSPVEAAAAYEAEIRAFFGEDEPRFDLIWLGMGKDGHTASLFPGTPPVIEAVRGESNHLVMTNYNKTAKNRRITFTPRLLNSAIEVIFLVAGEEKTATLEQVIRGPYQPLCLPAQLVRPEKGRLTWMLDKKAAGRLHGGTELIQAR